MINVLVCGISGDMGKRVYLTARNNDLFNVVCGVDKTFKSEIEFDCPLYSSFEEVKEIVDVIIDFSTPEVFNDLIAYAIENKCAIVEGTTGFTSKQKETISKASEKIAIFMPTNVSKGVNTLLKLCLEAAKTLDNKFDIEIIEEHKACKANAPSMTARMIAEAINETLGCNKKITSGRKGNGERLSDEICIHSVRGGGAPGRTQILFIGEDETITITHEVHSTTLYAQGALDIAEFISKKPCGLYNLGDFFKN